MADLKITGLDKYYGSVHAVRGVDLEIPAGEFTVLVGQSGCGKSTLLRTIAGLEDISDGTIEIAGQVVNDLEPRNRDIAMVFQNYALYPYMKVYDNIAFGLRARKTPKDEIDTKVHRAAQMLAIDHLLDRYPRQLSGGQLQRVAIGRAVVRNARLYLFDEPLSNLDAQLRDEMRGEIKRLHQELGKTMIYVTHDQIEAMTMADKIVVMNGGHVEQIGSPLELYDFPANLFVAGFIGSPAMNFLHGMLETTPEGRAVRIAPDCAVSIDPTQQPDGREVILGIRPEHLIIKSSQPNGANASEASGIEADVIVTEPTGADTQIFCRVAGKEVVAISRERHLFSPATRIRLDAQSGKTCLFDGDTGQRL